MRATILIATQAEQAGRVFDTLEERVLDEIHLVAGIYDLIVVINVDTVGELRTKVVEEIHATAGVIRTVTLLHLNEDEDPIPSQSAAKERLAILITTEAGRVISVQERLKSEDIVSVALVTGNYDIVAIVDGDSLEAINRWTNGVVHRIHGVERTETLLYL